MRSTVSAFATTLSNTATVTAGAGVTDSVLGNNSATDSDTLTPKVDLSVTKVDNFGGSSISHATGSVVPGTTITYTIVVSNTGPSAAIGTNVADTFPPKKRGMAFAVLFCANLLRRNGRRDRHLRAFRRRVHLASPKDPAQIRVD